jgi:hypothetical protein
MDHTSKLDTDAMVALTILGTTNIPRFISATFGKWLGAPAIKLVTHTGGTNRTFYESEASTREHFPDHEYAGPWNTDLRKLPGWLIDGDGETDPERIFYYKVPNK